MKLSKKPAIWTDNIKKLKKFVLYLKIVWFTIIKEKIKNFEQHVHL